MLPVLLSLLVLAVPAAVAAADAPVEIQRNSTVVFVLIVLLLGSVTAGLLFASPLRGRLVSSSAPDSHIAQPAAYRPTGRSGLPPMPGGDIFGADEDPVLDAAPPSAQPQAAQPQSRPSTPQTAPWSTGMPSPAEKWGPRTRP